MSGFLNSTVEPLNEVFAGVAPNNAGDVGSGGNSSQKKKRPSPLSLRLSEEERSLLEDQAGRQSLNAYIKNRLFGKDGARSKSQRYKVVEDYEALARVLSALGQTGLFGNLSMLMEQIEEGKVVLSPQAEEEIAVMCACVLLMRDDLVKALGLRED